METKQTLSLDTKISLGLFVVVFVVYFLTLCPTIYPGPSADAVCDVKGIGLTPPTAHPIWLILGRLFAHLSSNTAYVLNFMSALFGAATIALLYGVLSQVSHTRTAEEEARYQTHPQLRQAAALAGALLVAFSRPFWESSVLAGSDTLNTFFLVLIVLLIARYVKTSKSRYALAFGLIYGLAIGNYPTLFLLAPIFLVFLLVRCRALLDDPIAIVLMFLLFGVGLLPALYEPRLYQLQGKDFVIHAKTFGLAFSAFVDTYFRSMKLLFLAKNALFDWTLWLFLPTFVPILFFMIGRREYERGSPTATNFTYLVRYIFVFLFTIVGLAHLCSIRIGPLGTAGLDYPRYPRYLGSYVVAGGWFAYVIGYWLIVLTGNFKATGTDPEPKVKYRKVAYILGVIIALALPVASFVTNYAKSTKRSARYAERFALGLLRSSPDNAIIVVPVAPVFASVGSPLRYFQSLHKDSPLGREKTIIDLNAAYFDFQREKRVETARYLAETVFGRKVAQPRTFFTPEHPFAATYDGILKCETLRALEARKRESVVENWRKHPRPIYGLVNNFFLSPFHAGNEVMNKDYRAEPAGLLCRYRSRLEHRDNSTLIKDNTRLWKQLLSDIGVTNDAHARKRRADIEEKIIAEYSKSANDFGVFCQIAGRLDLAEKFYHRALTLVPENCSAVVNMASVMMSKGDSQRAEELNKKYESLLKQPEKQQIDSLRTFGLALDVARLLNTAAALASEQTAEAAARRLGILRLISDIVPRNARVREMTGDLLLSSQATFSVEEARSEYLAALERTDPKDKPQTKTILGKLGDVYARLDNNSQAEKFLAKALDADEPITQLRLMQFYLSTDQKPSQVKKLATNILEKEPADEDAKKKLAPAKKEAAIIMAKVLLKSDGAEKAKEFLNQYLTPRPQDADILLALAAQLRNDMKLDAVTTWLFEKYGDIRKELPISWIPNLAELYLRQKKYDALMQMKTPVVTGPNTDLARFYYFKGVGYEALGKSANSTENYEKAMSLLPQDYGNFGVIVANNLSWLYFKSGELGKAYDIIEKAVARDPANSFIWDTYGWIIYKGGGDFDKAFELIEHSHLANPDVGIIAYHYAKLLIEKGLTEIGMAVLERAIASGIQSKEELEDAQKILESGRTENGKGDSAA